MFDKITSSLRKIPALSLRKIPALSQFTDTEIKTLLDNVDSSFVDYEENQIIIREGAISKNIYIVVEGKLGNYINKLLTNGHSEQSIDELVPGDVFGEINLKKALAQEHVGTIRAFEKTTLLKINRWLLSDYLDQQNVINLLPLFIGGETIQFGLL